VGINLIEIMYHQNLKQRTNRGASLHPFSPAFSTTMSESWAPNETAAQLWNERCIFIGQLIGAIGYGM
jgi:hypothetical protein